MLDEQLNIIIAAQDKSSAAFKSAAESTKKFDKAIKSTSKGSKRMQENIRHLSTNIAIMDGPLGATAGRLNSFGAALGRVNPIVLAVTVALTAYVTFMAKAAKATADENRMLRRFEGQLRATGKETEFTTAELNEMSIALARNTLASIEGSRDAVSALLGFKNVSKGVFNDALKVAQDFTAVFGGDLRANVIKLGRAFDNPREGLQSLSRRITTFTPAIREMISTMFESGQKLEAQTLIIDKLKESVGGASEAEAGGLAGAWDTLSENVKLFMAEAGRGQGIVDKLTRSVTWLGRALGDTADGQRNAREATRIYTNELLPLKSQLEAIGVELDANTGKFLALATEAREAAMDMEIEFDVFVPAKKIEEDIKSVSSAINAIKNTQVNVPKGSEQFAAMSEVIRNLEKDLSSLQDQYVKLFDVPDKGAGEDFAKNAEDRKRLNKLMSVGESAQEKYNNKVIEFLSLSKSVRDENGKLLVSEEQFYKTLEGFATKNPAVRQDEMNARKEAGQQRAFNSLKLSLMTEEQYIDESYRQRQEKLNEYFSQSTISQEEFNELTLQNTNKFLDKKQGLEERNKTSEQKMWEGGWQGKTKILSDSMGAIGNLMMTGGKKQFEIGKKLNIAAAIANTAQAITSALATPPAPLGFALAATAAATGLAQIQSIRQTKYGGGGSVARPGGGMSSNNINSQYNAPKLNAPTAIMQAPAQRNVNFTINAVDAAGVQDVLVQNRGLITNLVRAEFNENGERL